MILHIFNGNTNNKYFAINGWLYVYIPPTEERKEFQRENHTSNTSFTKKNVGVLEGNYLINKEKPARKCEHISIYYYFSDEYKLKFKTKLKVKFFVWGWIVGRSTGFLCAFTYTTKPQQSTQHLNKIFLFSHIFRSKTRYITKFFIIFWCNFSVLLSSGMPIF
jgi:hypothetical protein